MPELYSEAWQAACQDHYRVFNVNGRKCPAENNCPVCRRLKDEAHRPERRASRYITLASELDKLETTIKEDQ